MHILSFYARQFNIHTAVILPHVHGKEDSSLFLRVPSDLSSAHKTSIPAQSLICAQHTVKHMDTHFYSFKMLLFLNHSKHTKKHNRTH